jgi:hypothetical protein
MYKLLATSLQFKPGLETLQIFVSVCAQHVAEIRLREKILALNGMNQGIHDLYSQYLSHRKYTCLHYKDYQLSNAV